MMMKAASNWPLVFCAGLALCEARSLWSSAPATFGGKSADTYLLKAGYPVGNGKLGGESGDGASGGFEVSPN